MNAHVLPLTLAALVVCAAQAPAQSSFAFVEIWTAKEAFLKAMGLGIRRTLRSFDLSGVSSEDWVELEGWLVRSEPAPEGYAAAVCRRG